MISRKDDLRKLYDKWEKKRDKAEQAYQSTGIQRYDREYRNADDICTACEMALNSEKAHSAMSALRCFKSDAKFISKMPDGQSKQAAINKLLWELEMCEEGE